MGTRWDGAVNSSWFSREPELVTLALARHRDAGAAALRVAEVTVQVARSAPATT